MKKLNTAMKGLGALAAVGALTFLVGTTAAVHIQQAPHKFFTWTTATRPTSPVVALTGYNSDLGALETFTGAAWTAASAGAPPSVSTQSGTTYTLASGDCGSMIRTSNGSAVTVTMPNSLSVGCQIAIAQMGAGQVTVAAGSGATMHSAHSFTKTFGQYAVIIVTVDTNGGGTAADYVFTGDGA